MEMLWLDPHKLVGSPPMFLLPSGKTRTTQLGLGDAEISQHGILRLREEDVPSVGTRHREAQSVEKGGKNKQHNTTMDKKQSFLFMIFFLHCFCSYHILSSFQAAFRDYVVCFPDVLDHPNSKKIRAGRVNKCIQTHTELRSSACKTRINGSEL